MLIITGSGRSGTTVVSRFCHNMGYLVGGKMDNTVNAGMEEPFVTEINRAIISQGFENKHRLLIRDCTRKIIKDPLFCQGHVLDTWLSIRKDIKLIICLRDMNSVKKSVESSPHKFNKLFKPETDVSKMFNFWLKISKLNIEYRTITFPDFLDQYDLVYKYLTDFNLDIDYKMGKRAWDSLVDKKKVHY